MLGHFDPPALEAFGDDAGGADLLEAELGVFVEVVAPFGVAGGVLFKFLKNGVHVSWGSGPG